MSFASLDAIQAEIENASTLVALCKSMKCSHRQYLLNLAVNAVVSSLELLRLEIRGERTASATVLPGADDLEAAESGQSTPATTPNRASQAAGGFVPLPAQPAEKVQDEPDGTPFLSASAAQTPRAPFLEPLRVSPVSTPRPTMEVVVDVPVAAAAPDDADSTTHAETTYKDLLAAVGNPTEVFLHLKKQRSYVSLAVDYSGQHPTSSFTEDHGKVYRGTLKNVAARIKYLRGYKAPREMADLPENEKRATVTMGKDICYRDLESNTYVEIGAP